MTSRSCVSWPRRLSSCGVAASSSVAKRRMCSTTRRTTTRSSWGPAFQGRAGNRRNEAHWRLVKGDEMNDLHYMSATEALKQFKSPKLSPVELVHAVIDRATAVDPAINAFAQPFFDEALTQARAAEARYAGNGKPPRA